MGYIPESKHTGKWPKPQLSAFSYISEQSWHQLSLMLWAASEVEPLALAALFQSPYEAERMPYELLPLNNDQTSDLWAE